MNPEAQGGLAAVRWTVGLMAVVAVLEALVMLVGLRLVGSSTPGEGGLAVVALLGTALVGLGAFFAIRVARV